MKRTSGGHGGWCRGFTEGRKQRLEKVGASGVDGGTDDLEFRVGHLERVEQTAGTPGADGIGGDALHDLADGSKDGIAAFQGREIERRLLEAAGAPRKKDPRAGVVVAEGPAA